jgi:hypothetical protein
MAQPTHDYIAALRRTWRVRVPAIEVLSTTFNLDQRALEDLYRNGSLPNSFVLWRRRDSRLGDSEYRDQVKGFTAAELQSAWGKVRRAKPTSGQY